MTHYSPSDIASDRPDPCAQTLPFPEDPQETAPPFWYFFPGELECFWLQTLRRVVKETSLQVGYPGPFRQLSSQVTYQALKPAGPFAFRATGTVSAYLDQQPLMKLTDSPDSHTLCLPHDGLLKLVITVDDTTQTIPALMTSHNETWLVTTATCPQQTRIAHREQHLKDGTPPQFLANPTVTITPVCTDGEIWDAQREILAQVEIHADQQPRLLVGESKAEATDQDPAVQEQSTELRQLDAHTWLSRHQLAFRYLKLLHAGQHPKIICHASSAPLQKRGAFQADNQKRLSQIWETAAYTLRLCVNLFILDGVKRDRLPWAGDLAISLLSMAHSFGDGRTVRRSLTVLGAAITPGYDVNSLVDYSMWLIISHDLYQRYFADRPYLQQHYQEIKALMDDLIRKYDDSRFQRLPHSTPLIDWGHPTVENALLMLFQWSLKAAESLALRQQDTESCNRWRHCRETLSDWLRKYAVNDRGLFCAENPQRSCQLGRHVNIFAILSGLATGKQAETIARWLTGKELPEVATPYMAILDVMAIARGGLPRQAIAKLEHLWGGMLDQGATTFWEAYDPMAHGDEHLAFYDRKYGKSLCHAWGAGPAFALPMIAFGIRPLEDGWKSFSLNDAPCLPELKLQAVIPTPQGNIVLEQDGNTIRVEAPQGCRRQQR